jgi:hypothetical protein
VLRRGCRLRWQPVAARRAYFLGCLFRDLPHCYGISEMGTVRYLYSAMKTNVTFINCSVLCSLFSAFSFSLLLHLLSFSSPHAAIYGIGFGKRKSFAITVAEFI